MERSSLRSWRLGFDGVPVLAHLDFVLVANGAVRILELKSTENIPDNLYTSYEVQHYGQLGFMAKYWEQPRFRKKIIF